MLIGIGDAPREQGESSQVVLQEEHERVVNVERQRGEERGSVLNGGGGGCSGLGAFLVDLEDGLLDDGRDVDVAIGWRHSRKVGVVVEKVRQKFRSFEQAIAQREENER